MSLLNEVVTRGKVIVGVSDDIPAMGLKEDGVFKGFDIDFAKALAAAIFDDSDAIEFVPQTLPERFSNVSNGIVDVTSQQVSYNLVRDATFNVDFSAITLHDCQVVLVPEKSSIMRISDLNNHLIGMRKGTTALHNIQSTFDKLGITLNPVVYDNYEELLDSFQNGYLDAITNDTTAIFNLFTAENRLIGAPLSQELLAMAVPENESEWADVVRWVNYVPIQAKEFGITSENVDDFIANSTDPQIQQFLGLTGELGNQLGLPDQFSVSIIKSVGNLDEIIERNFGFSEGGIRNKYTPNDICSKGGAAFAPPFTGSLPSSSTLEKMNIGSGLNNTIYDSNFFSPQKNLNENFLIRLEQLKYPDVTDFFSSAQGIPFNSWLAIIPFFIFLAVYACAKLFSWLSDFHPRNLFKKDE